MLEVLAVAARELTLFAAVGFLVGGLDDLLVDILYFARALRRRVFVYTRFERATIEDLPERDRRLAIFVPAWAESQVIGAMLTRATQAFESANYRIYVGTYPNDPATNAIIAQVAKPQIRHVVNRVPGPTTKAQCLNECWRALCEDEAREGRRFDAIVLHDAEDVAHPHELRVYAALCDRFALIQLPVVPLVDPQSRWIAGHYLDEFAEAHGKTLVVREAIGAGLPSAGVGCAFDRALLGEIAATRGGQPFDEDSLTEDYELGLRIAERGGRAALVRLTDCAGILVAIRAHFPATFAAAVRQKARWIAGIALHGWDRLGWQRRWTERWMRAHDRRALLAALVLLAAYAALVLQAALVVAELWGWRKFTSFGPAVTLLLHLVLALTLWRCAMRAMFVGRLYGWREGLRAVPRMVVGNIIAMAAARRALILYLRARRDGVVRWDKTEHVFPDLQPKGRRPPQVARCARSRSSLAGGLPHAR